MKRREFITLLGGAAAAWPLAARAQQPAMPVIGALHAASRAGTTHLMAAYFEGLKSEGYVEAQNMMVEYRWADGVFDRIPEMMAELVRLRPDVIRLLGPPHAPPTTPASPERLGIFHLSFRSATTQLLPVL